MSFLLFVININNINTKDVKVTDEAATRDTETNWQKVTTDISLLTLQTIANIINIIKLFINLNIFVFIYILIYIWLAEKKLKEYFKEEMSFLYKNRQI